LGLERLSPISVHTADRARIASTDAMRARGRLLSLHSKYLFPTLRG
jgi:hypothetical protein